MKFKDTLITVATACFAPSTGDIAPYIESVGVPAPLNGSIDGILDVTGTYKFQINTNGVFQNVSTLPQGGRYWVYAVYLAKN